MEVTRDSLKTFLTGILEGKVDEKIIDTKTTEYLKSNSQLEMLGFISNDLANLYSEEQMTRLLSSLSDFSKGTFTTAEIKQSGLDIKNNNIKPGQMPIQENHKLINITLQNLCNGLNELGVDYYLVGALPCYLLTGAEDKRYHDDIDLMLNEKDIPKVEAMLNGSDFTFSDDRMDTPKRLKPGKTMPSGDHEVCARHNSSEFHIGFFCFERGPNNEVIHKDYFKDENGNLKVYKHMQTKEQSELSYDDNLHQYGNTQFKMASLESVYRLKKYTMNNPGREKDKTDVDMIERSGRLNQEKLAALDKAPHIKDKVESIFSYRSPKEVEVASCIQQKNQIIAQTKQQSRTQEKPKVYIKTDNSNKGMATSSSLIYIIIALAILSLVLYIYK